jgi:hypothetical protein
MLSYDNLDLSHKFCRNCATLYEDLTYRVKQTETDTCPICNFYEVEKSRVTQGCKLIDLILNKSKELGRRVNPIIEVPNSNELIPLESDLKYDYRCFSNNEMNVEVQKFMEKEYFGLERLYSEHNLAEFFYLADQIVNNWNTKNLLDTSSKIKYSLFRYSSFNPPNLVQVDEKVDEYNHSIYNNSETRKEHIEKHLVIPIGEISQSGKSTAKPHIYSSSLPNALIEVNKLILKLDKPCDVICLRALNNGQQMRIYYKLNPVLVLMINDKGFSQRSLSSNNKPLLITCYTSKDMQLLLRPTFSNSTLDFTINLVPDFLGAK